MPYLEMYHAHNTSPSLYPMSYIKGQSSGPKSRTLETIGMRFKTYHTQHIVAEPTP